MELKAAHLGATLADVLDDHAEVCDSEHMPTFGIPGCEGIKVSEIDLGADPDYFTVLLSTGQRFAVKVEEIEP